jgi:hypothetical protein
MYIASGTQTPEPHFLLLYSVERSEGVVLLLVSLTPMLDQNLNRPLK